MTAEKLNIRLTDSLIQNVSAVFFVIGREFSRVSFECAGEKRSVVETALRGGLVYHKPVSYQAFGNLAPVIVYVLKYG